MVYEVEVPRPRGRPKRTWREVVWEDCQARKLNKEDAIDRCKWRKIIKDVRWSGWVWVGECFFWYRPTRVVPDQRPLNGCVCLCVCAFFLFGFHCITVVARWLNWPPAFVSCRILTRRRRICQCRSDRATHQSVHLLNYVARRRQLISRRAAPCILNASASQKYLSSRRRYGDIALEIRPSCDASRTSTVLSVQTIRMYLGTLEHLKCRTVKFQHSFIPYCLDHYV